MGGDVDRLNGGGSIEWTHIEYISGISISVALYAHWLTSLMNQRSLTLKLLLLVLSCDLGVVLENASPLVAPLDVLAVDTLAILVARDPCLKTLAVFFETLTFLAIAPLGVTLLSPIFRKNICGRICGF